MCNGCGSIVILGGGVAGSVLAYLVKRNNIDVHLYDITPRYTKACGEAIPVQIISVLEENTVPRPYIVSKVSVFSIYNPAGKIIRRVEFDKPIWYIVDKGEWLNRLRESVGTRLIRKKIECSSLGISGLVFDARGPFSSKGFKIVVWQAYMENVIGLSEEALQIIDFRRSPGLVWAFSKGRVINIGGGFVDISDPKSISIKMLEKIFNIDIDKYIIKDNYSILTLIPQIRLYDKDCIRVGEAAGLVMSLGGEGIRPAILSAIAAYKSLNKMDDNITFNLNNYVSILRPLIYQVRLNRYIFEIGAMLGQNMVEKILGGVSKELLEEWLSGDLGLKTQLAGLIHSVTKAILS